MTSEIYWGTGHYFPNIWVCLIFPGIQLSSTLTSCVQSCIDDNWPGSVSGVWLMLDSVSLAVFSALNKAWCVNHFSCYICDRKMSQKWVGISATFESFRWFVGKGWCCVGVQQIEYCGTVWLNQWNNQKITRSGCTVFDAVIETFSWRYVGR